MRRRVEVPSECKVVSLDRTKVQAVILEQELPVHVIQKWAEKFKAEGLSVVFCGPGTHFFQLREGQTYILKMPPQTSAATISYFIGELQKKGFKAFAVDNTIEIELKNTDDKLPLDQVMEGLRQYGIKYPGAFIEGDIDEIMRYVAKEKL